MSETQTLDGTSTTTRLAWSVLFGDESLRDVDHELLRSLQNDPEAWGRLILDTWATFTALGGRRAPTGLREGKAGTPSATTTVTRIDPQEDGAEAQQERRGALDTTPTSADRAEITASRPAGLQDRAESPAAVPPAPRAQAPAAPAPTGTPKPLDFFDPDEEDEFGPVRRTATADEVKARLVELIAEVSGYPAERSRRETVAGEQPIRSASTASVQQWCWSPSRMSAPGRRCAANCTAGVLFQSGSTGTRPSHTAQTGAFHATATRRARRGCCATCKRLAQRES
jgi:hypothetical protein